jgi:hypothetical protein
MRRSARDYLCIKIRLGHGEDRNKNKPPFDIARQLAVAAFIQISGRVAARTISFWSRRVAVSE